MEDDVTGIEQETLVLLESIRAKQERAEKQGLMTTVISYHDATK